MKVVDFFFVKIKVFELLYHTHVDTNTSDSKHLPNTYYNSKTWSKT